MSEPRCEGMTSDRWERQCVRTGTIEVGGKLYCPRHAAGLRRSASARKASDDRYREREERATRVQDEAENLSSVLGVQVLPHYPSFEQGYSEHAFLVPADWLREIAAATTDDRSGRLQDSAVPSAAVHEPGEEVSERDDLPGSRRDGAGASPGQSPRSLTSPHEPGEEERT